MSDETKANPENPAAAAQPEVIEKAQFDKLRDEYNKTTNLLKDLQAQQKNSQTLQMKEKEQYKELWEKTAKEKEDAEKRADNLQNSYLNDKKYSAFSEATRKLGLKNEAVSDLELVDLSDLNIETTSTGKINVIGADKAAERLKTMKPHWFQDKPPTVNTNGVRTLDPSGPVGLSDVMAAEKEGKKSGDMTKYKALVLKFNQQRIKTS